MKLQGKKGEKTMAMNKEVKKTSSPAAPKATEYLPFVVGETYLFRLVTHYWVGRIVAVTGMEIVIEDASWVASTGRFSTTIATGALDEVEKVQGRVVLGRGALVDAVEWKHPLPTETK